MRPTIVFMVFTVILAVVNLPAQQSADLAKAGKLVVWVKGLNNNKGDVKIGLFNSRESFEGNKAKFKGAVLPIRNRQVFWELDSLPYGDYAIKLFHDEDQDDKLDKNFIGIPREQYGFSNDARGRFGPPKFEKARFTLDRDSLMIEINLK